MPLMQARANAPDAQTVREFCLGLKRGDAAVFDAVYAHYRPRLFTFIARLIGRREIADELLQETWLRLAKNASTLADDTDVGAWLFTVATNAARSYRRWQVLDFERVKDALFPSSSERPSPFENVASLQTHRQLERMLLRLSPSDREVLLLAGVEGLEPHQAATVLGLKPEALRQRLSRARARLRALMTEAGQRSPDRKTS